MNLPQTQGFTAAATTSDAVYDPLVRSIPLSTGSEHDHSKRQTAAAFAFEDEAFGDDAAAFQEGWPLAPPPFLEAGQQDDATASCRRDLCTGRRLQLAF